MNDKYIAERQGIIEAKLDLVLLGLEVLLKKDDGRGFTGQFPTACPVCLLVIKYNFASDGAVIRKCGCSTGKTSVDVNSFSPTPTK